MGKKRLIDCDELFFCELFDALGDRAVLIYERLWSLAEDWGGYEPNYFEIAMKCGGLRAKIEEVRATAAKLIELKKVIPYEIGGREYHWLVNLTKHQPLDNPSPPRLPLPPWVSCTICRYKSGKKYAKYDIDASKLPEGYEYLTGRLPAAGEKGLGHLEKKGKEKKGKEKKPPVEPCVQCSEYVFMKPSERAKIVQQFGEKATVEAITILNNYKGSSGKKYKSDYLAILNWVIDRMREKGRLKPAKPMSSGGRRGMTAEEIRQRSLIIEKQRKERKPMKALAPIGGLVDSVMGKLATAEAGK